MRMPNLVLERKIEQAIERWFSSGDSKPLLIQGARRTGKTFTVEHVGRRLAGDRFVKLDFQTDLAAIERIFSGASDDVDAIVARIAEYKRVDLTPGDSLIFFDEVQLHEKALNALRFFSDSWWRIIASGSLLGVTTKKRSLPFPSGVRQLTMTPLDFEEFLWAQGERRMADDIRTHVETLEPYMLHEQALGWYRRYLVVGGKPLPVRRWCETRSMEAVAEEQREIDATYTADMTDPQNGISGISAKRIWESLPRQLLRASTKKFKYADVVRGGRRARLLEPLEWLAAAGIVSIHERTSDTQAPLVPYNDEEGSFFKVYVADTGIMFQKFGIDPALVLDVDARGAISPEFRGALAENAVMQALRARGIASYYWMPEGSGAQGEVDFVYQTPQAEVIPVEVKSARNVTAKSLRRLMREGRSPYAIRLSEQEFGRTVDADGNELRSIPLYATYCM